MTGSGCAIETPGRVTTCGTLAAADVIVGCVHEHMETIPVCNWHIARHVDGGGPSLVCTDCEDAGCYGCRVKILKEKTR